MKLYKYLLNCFLLLIPVLIWNVIFHDHLPKSYRPEIFDQDIPKLINYSEIITRLVVFTLPLMMVFSLKSKLQKTGFFIYLLGIILYFSSWMIMIISPESAWCQSLFGFMAPAYTTIIFFIGIGMIGNQAFFKIPYLSFIYIFTSCLFVGIHTAHTYIVFMRL